MFQQEEQIQQVELSIEQAQGLIDRMQAMNRLRVNADFQKVIEEGYFQHEASRAVLLRADPTMQTKEKQKNVDNVITSIGGLYQYFITVIRQGNMALKSIEEDKFAREELLREQMDGEPLQ